MAGEFLSSKEENIALIASYAARGDLTGLESSLERGLDQGLSVNEIKEVLVQLYAYCGFPRSLNALAVFKRVAEGRTEAPQGEAGYVLPQGTDKFAYGDRVQVELTGGHVAGGLFEFAPAIDQYLKEHLFADIFARGVLSRQEREAATIAALASMSGVQSQLDSHVAIGRNTGLSADQIAEILDLTKSARSGPFPLGEKNDAYARYFTGQSYLAPLTGERLGVFNVTFEPGCRNNWHIHHKGGQILLVTAGRGYYQAWGEGARELKPGDVVNIPPEVKHWHGAAPDSWFAHVAIEIPAEGASNEWLEPVSGEDYGKLK